MGDATAAAARRALRQSSPCRRHPRPRPVPGDRAGRGPGQQGAVRSGAEAPCAGQEGGDGARPDGLSDGRHDRRRSAATMCCWRRRSSSPNDEIDEIVERLGERHRRRSCLSHRLRAGGDNEPATPTTPSGRECRCLGCADVGDRPTVSLAPGHHDCAGFGRRADRCDRPRPVGSHERHLGRTVVVDNVAGAGGSIGVGKRRSLRARRLHAGHRPVVALCAEWRDLRLAVRSSGRFRADRHGRHRPVAARRPQDLPANDLKSLVAWLKANPDKASAGTGGVGSPGHISGIFFQKMTGTSSSSCPIAARRRPCATWWRGRSI